MGLSIPEEGRWPKAQSSKGCGPNHPAELEPEQGPRPAVTFPQMAAPPAPPYTQLSQDLHTALSS